MQYSMTAMVKAMKIQEIILKAVSGQILWVEAADIIGISYRSMKRWKKKYEEHGYDGLWDRRMKSPSPKRVPLQELQMILRLYKEKYEGFNARHFHEKLHDHHGITRGYTFVKNALQTAGYIDKIRVRGKHRKKRPRKPLVGMMLHLDGSPHEWMPDLPGQFFDLLVLMDDATNKIYEMKLVEEENLVECMTLIRDCIKKHGFFCSIYTDRAPQFFYTPKGSKTALEGHFTEIGRALNECGIRMIPSYSPQGRGRGERMNETLQGRLPNEFKLHGIKTVEDANRFLQQVYIKDHNKRFTFKPEQEGSAFLLVPSHLNLDLIFCIKQERTVNSDNTVSFERTIMQLEPSHLRISFAKCRVMVHKHLDDTFTVMYGPHILGRYDLEGTLLKIAKSQTHETMRRHEFFDLNENAKEKNHSKSEKNTTSSKQRLLKCA